MRFNFLPVSRDDSVSNTHAHVIDFITFLLLWLNFLVFNVLHLFTFFTVLLVHTERVGGLSDCSLFNYFSFGNLEAISSSFFSVVNWRFVSQRRSAYVSSFICLIWSVFKASSEIASCHFVSWLFSIFSLLFTSFVLSISYCRNLRFIIFNSKILNILWKLSNIVLSVIILIVCNSHFSFFLLCIWRSPLCTSWGSISKQSLRVSSRIHVVFSGFSGCWSSSSISRRSSIETLRISHLVFSVFNRVTAVIIIFLIREIHFTFDIIIWNASISSKALARSIIS